MLPAGRAGAAPAGRPLQRHTRAPFLLQQLTGAVQWRYPAQAVTRPCTSALQHWPLTPEIQWQSRGTMAYLTGMEGGRNAVTGRPCIYMGRPVYIYGVSYRGLRVHVTHRHRDRFRRAGASRMRESRGARRCSRPRPCAGTLPRERKERMHDELKPTLTGRTETAGAARRSENSRRPCMHHYGAVCGEWGRRHLGSTAGAPRDRRCLGWPRV